MGFLGGGLADKQLPPWFATLLASQQGMGGGAPAMPPQGIPPGGIGYMAPQFAGQFPASPEPAGDAHPMPVDESGPPMFGGGIPGMRGGARRPVPGPLQPVSDSAPQMPGPPSGAPMLGQDGGKPKAGPAQPGGIGGFFHRVGHGLAESAHNGELPLRIAALQAANAGQYGQAGEIMSRITALRAARQEAQQAGAVRQSFANNLMKQGMDASQAEIVMQNPGAFATEYATRFRTRDGAPGTTISTPNLSGAPTLQQFPTAAEQAARAAGIQPGTPAYSTFIQDAELNAQGPTGTATARRGQDITERDSIRSTQTSRDNNIRSTGATVRGQDLSHTDRVTDPRRVARPTAPPTPTTVIGSIMARQAAGQPLNRQEQGLLAQYQAGRGRRAGRASADIGGAPTPVPGRTATNARGIRVQQMSDGTWRPAQ